MGKSFFEAFASRALDKEIDPERAIAILESNLKLVLKDLKETNLKVIETTRVLEKEMERIRNYARVRSETLGEDRFRHEIEAYDRALQALQEVGNAQVEELHRRFESLRQQGERIKMLLLAEAKKGAEDALKGINDSLDEG